MYAYFMGRLTDNFIWNVSYFRLSLIFLICFNLFSCSNKEYPDLSHLPLHYFDYERDCKKDNQCKSIGYGGFGSCRNSKESVSGYIVYSTLIGPENISRLKKLAKDSRDSYQDCIADPKCRGRYVLEEVLPACSNHKVPTLFCHNGKCRKRSKWGFTFHAL